MENLVHEKIGKLLRVDKHIIAELDAAMERATGKRNVLKHVVEENEALMLDRLRQLGIPHRDAKAIEVYDALISKVESDDLKIYESLGVTSPGSFEAAAKICGFVHAITAPPQGYFLRMEKAAELLLAEPPKKILAALGYTTVSDMLAHEDICEVYSALRFLEDQEWQNKVFFKQYEKLQPSDFEVRHIQLRALNEKWAKAAEKFVAKKYHNVSHLKELGVIFIIPVFLGHSGETLRVVSLLLHYLHEIAYYSSLFQEFAKNRGATFASDCISLLRGDVIEQPLPVQTIVPPKAQWLVVQRYLGKDDEHDWRLLAPHINPEALHWMRAESDLLKIVNVVPAFQRDGLDFWQGLGWVGDFFQTETGVPVLVSFNIVDTVMSLVKEKEMIKYLYHQEEALWNRIFTGYFSEAELEKFSKQFILQGWFEI